MFVSLNVAKAEHKFILLYRGAVYFVSQFKNCAFLLNDKTTSDVMFNEALSATRWQYQSQV